MPRIPVYTPQEGAGVSPETSGRRAVASDFGGDGLATLGGAVQGSANILYDAQEKRDVSDAAAKAATARAQWTVELQQRAAKSDPGDPNFASTFNRDFGDYLQTVETGYSTVGGQRAWKQQASELASHFVQSAGVYQAHAMGVKAVQNYNVFLDQNRSALLADPTQFDSVMQSTTHALSDPSGPYANIPGEQRAKLDRETRANLALSAGQGLIRLDPEGAAQAFREGKYDQYLDADKKYTLERQADIAIRAKETQQRLNELARERAERVEQEAIADKYVKQLVADPTSVSAVDIANSNLKATTKLQWVGPGGILDRANAEDPGRDQKLYGPAFNTAFQLVHADEDNPRKIRDDSILLPLVGQKDGLTMAGYDKLRDEIKGRRSVEGSVEASLKNGLVQTAKTALTGTDPLLHLRDPKGEEILQRFMAYFLPEFDRQKKAGKTAQQLLDPQSPDYLGKTIWQMKRRPDVFMRDMMEDNPGYSFGNAPGLNEPPTVPRR